MNLFFANVENTSKPPDKETLRFLIRDFDFGTKKLNISDDQQLQSF
jgi:hypothetical protein